MKKRIRILYGLEAASGGALKHLVYLVTHLNKDIFEIAVILSPRSADAEAEIDKLTAFGVTVVRIPMTREISLLKDLVSLIRITTYLFRNKFDIVHSHSSKAGVYFRIAAFINRVKTIIYTPHCFYFQSKTGRKKLIWQFFERLLGVLTDIIIVSENEMNQCIAFKIAPPEKLVNINNAINFDLYQEVEREVALGSLGLLEDSIVVGTVGRLVEQKDLLTLITAAKRLIQDNPNLYFIIAGSGELNDYLQDKILEFGLHGKVLLVGYQHEIGHTYSAIDIFVSTSLWEGLPYVLLEAMWFKKPIIATDLGYGDIFDDYQGGYFIPPGDISALCEKLRILIADNQLRVTMGERNSDMVKANYSFRKFVKKHEILYLEHQK